MRPSQAPPVFVLQCALLHGPLLPWLLSLLPSAMAQLPYSPTRILQHGSLLYVFRPASNSMAQFELGSVDVSSTIASAGLPFTTLYPSLPFLDPDHRQAFTPLLANGRNITVYSGDCASGASGAEVWSFTPDTSEKSGNGTWRQEDVSFAAHGDHVAAIGANYLNGGVAFSSLVDSRDVDIGAYFFGGMCPFQNGESDWQAAANYSNLMVTLEPVQDHTTPLEYALGVSSTRGPPIPEAGFSLTPLTPTFSNGNETQQQNLVLVGGHTSAAFINMSQVALFSLPQQGWTFVPVAQPDTSRTDLAIRADVDMVDPRSGHSAVLTADGQSIVIFGGWVGDVETPAEPQLAVLHIGDSYGGRGDWEWTVPDATGSGLPENSGVYGHGATMLPGDVMMIMGGYSTSASSSQQRRQSATANARTMFFNVSSNTWITEYKPPVEVASSQSSNDGLLSSPTQKAGLGVGLGVGMAAVLSLLVFYLWYSRRLKTQREVREKQINDLALNAHRYNIDSISPGLDGHGGEDYLDSSKGSYRHPTSGPRYNQNWRQGNGHEAERTGLLVEIPSPTRGLRRSLGGRVSHQIAPYEEGRVRGPGNIHPIFELEEEQESQATDRTPLTAQPEMAEQLVKQESSILDKAPVLDPFLDTKRAIGVEPISLSTISSSCQKSVEQKHIPTDWQLAMGDLISRRSNPELAVEIPRTKTPSDRTGSNLSDRSARSTFSSASASGSLSRSASMRASAILNTAMHTSPLKTPEVSPTTDKPNRHSGGWYSPVEARTQSFTSIRSNGRVDTDSFMTARSSFMQLQAEGETLLGGHPDRARPDTSSTTRESCNNPTYPSTEGSMSRADTVTAATSVADGLSRAGTKMARRKSWLGSVRRVLMRSSTTADRTRSFARTPPLEAYTDLPPSSTGMSPTDHRKSFPASTPPRRAASDASFWHSKRGRQDWLDDELDPNDPQARWRRNSGDDWGAPEDILYMENQRKRREWRERNSLLVSPRDSQHIAIAHTPIQPGELGVHGSEERPGTPAEEEDWDVEAAVERRVVQVMFTVPKSKLRVVNADIDRSSILSLPRENSREGNELTLKGEASSPGRVKDLAVRYDQLDSPKHSSQRTSPRPSPSPSIRSAKIRTKPSASSLASKQGYRSISGIAGIGKGKQRAAT